MPSYTRQPLGENERTDTLIRSCVGSLNARHYSIMKLPCLFYSRKEIDDFKKYLSSKASETHKEFRFEVVNISKQEANLYLSELEIKRI